MDKNISNEKKPLRLKVKTFVDLRRFTSKQLHKIVENFRAKNKAYEAKYKDMSALNYMKVVKRNELLAYKVRNSLVNLSDKQAKKSRAKLQEKWNKGRESLQEKLDNEEITEKQYKNKKEQLIYKTSKEMYARDMLGNREKPKNPRTQRIIRNVKNAVKTVGKGIATGASMVAGAVAFPFIMAYKGAKAVGRKALAIGRGGKVAAITAGKVVGNTAKSVAENVKNQVGPIAQEVKETENAKRDMKVAEKSKELDDAATISAKREIYDNSSKQTQSAIRVNDWKAALREDKKFYAKQQVEETQIEDPEKQAREAQRRENLHMDKEEQIINHKEAIEKVEGEVLTEEEVKKVYGDQEK